MLFHVTATHTEDNCPGYNIELIPPVMKGLEEREALARKHHVKILGFWSGAPEHVFYFVVDAENPLEIDLFLTECTPFRQAHRLTPVMTADELLRLGRETMAQAAASS